MLIRSIFARKVFLYYFFFLLENFRGPTKTAYGHKLVESSAGSTSLGLEGCWNTTAQLHYKLRCWAIGYKKSSQFYQLQATGHCFLCTPNTGPIIHLCHRHGFQEWQISLHNVWKLHESKTINNKIMSRNPIT